MLFFSLFRNVDSLQSKFYGQPLKKFPNGVVYFGFKSGEMSWMQFLAHFWNAIQKCPIPFSPRSAYSLRLELSFIIMEHCWIVSYDDVVISWTRWTMSQKVNILCNWGFSLGELIFLLTSQETPFLCNLFLQLLSKNVFDRTLLQSFVLNTFWYFCDWST